MPDANGHSSVERKGLTVRDLIVALLPDISDTNYREFASSPPDVFGVTASILRQNSSYVAIVDDPWFLDPSGPGKPATGLELNQRRESWVAHVKSLGQRWAQKESRSAPPDDILLSWEVVWTMSNDTKADELSEEKSEKLLWALVFLLATADEACAGIGISDTCKTEEDIWVRTAAQLNPGRRSSSGSTVCERIDASRAVVLPKLHTPANGITLRSLTHNLAFWDNGEAVGEWLFSPWKVPNEGINLLLLPWPLRIPTYAFHACSQRAPDNRFGLFHYNAPTTYARATQALPLIIAEILKTAEDVVGTGRIHCVVLPEMSVTRGDFKTIYDALNGNEWPKLLVAGVGDGKCRNEVWCALKLGSGETALRGFWSQGKHHRWRLNASQISSYGLGGVLDYSKDWWEYIYLQPRRVGFFQVNSWLTYCALVCEDLARQDPLSRLVRSVGPNLVIALLSDGPQLTNRWGARYATVLADDPGSSVLTLTSVGMVDLSREQFGENTGARSIGLWKDALSDRAKQLTLDQDSVGLILNLARVYKPEYTADMREEQLSSGNLVLSGVHQVRMAQPHPEGQFTPPSEQKCGDGCMIKPKRQIPNTSADAFKLSDIALRALEAIMQGQKPPSLEKLDHAERKNVMEWARNQVDSANKRVEAKSC
jgi:hypothetical protein